MIHVYMLDGRSDDQKRRLMEGITTLMVDVCGSKRERVGVVVHEVDARNWARGGVTLADEAPPPSGPAES
jgi:4-oxalocrotonate tautomerase